MRFLPVLLASLLSGFALAGDPPPPAPAPADHAHHAAGPAPVAMEAPPAGARVFFVQPQPDARVPSQLKVVMGVQGMAIQPAGELKAGTGHHHLIIDGPAIPLGEVVPKDDRHLHFGDGATETLVTLPPGEHTLTLQFADGAHRSYGPAMAATLKVKVE